MTNTIARRYTRPDWRGWYYEPEYQTLCYYPPGHATELYYVELTRCTCFAEAWDWLAHISCKTWVTDEVLAGLVRALSELFDSKGITQ